MADANKRSGSGLRRFQCSAYHPVVVNSLELHGLKTNLFTRAYGQLWELLLKSVLFYIYILLVRSSLSHVVFSRALV